MRWHTRLSSPSSSPLFPVACAGARWSWKMLIPLGWFSSFLYLIAVFADCPVNCVFWEENVIYDFFFFSVCLKLYFWVDTFAWSLSATVTRQSGCCSVICRSRPAQERDFWRNQWRVSLRTDEILLAVDVINDGGESRLAQRAHCVWTRPSRD